MTVYLGEGYPYPKPHQVPMPAAPLLADFYCEIGACRRASCPTCTGRPINHLFTAAPGAEPAP